jgi:exodeoxyribonuclease VII small subunit
MHGHTSEEQQIMSAHEKTRTDSSSVVPFEQALEALESLVEKLGRGQLSLEEALASFEQGITLARQCQDVLKEAEQKVKMLIDYENPDKTVAFGGDA